MVYGMGSVGVYGIWYGVCRGIWCMLLSMGSAGVYGIWYGVGRGIWYMVWGL